MGSPVCLDLKEDKPVIERAAMLSLDKKLLRFDCIVCFFSVSNITDLELQFTVSYLLQYSFIRKTVITIIAYNDVINHIHVKQ